MMGLIFVSWENYVAVQFGKAMAQTYRQELLKFTGMAPLINRAYRDEAFLYGVQVVSRLTHISADLLLRQFGRYYIVNDLTRHLCAYLLTQAENARDTLLLMRQAHKQMSVSPEGLTPPVFSYEFLNMERNHLLVTYESPRQLCGWFWGAVEGTADRFGERVLVREHSCVKRGDAQCRFEVYFQMNQASHHSSAAEMREQIQKQRPLSEEVLRLLPEREQDAVTLFELQMKLQHLPGSYALPRLSLLLEVVQRLQYTGLVATTASRTGDDLSRCRYWRLPLVGAG
ncbi:MAG: heme NO-binding domain-containing protein [Ktedonobacteraceae bacterium]|nr:heme NO-binding domain-containing protein [Ktedonobacteraceae bacterium]